MPRMARAIIPDYPHHVTQRGNFGMNVFADDDDRQRYLAWIIEYAEKYGVRIWAYCLMTNHVHYIAIPSAPNSLARMYNNAHMRYSQYFNRKQGQRGHLWQGRFFSCVLDDAHLYEAVRYIETNPVRAGIVAGAGEYGWSSARAHVAGANDPVISGDLPLLQSVENWAEYLGGTVGSAWVESFRKATQTGRPMGSDVFVKRMEAFVGRRLHALPRGRPKAET